MFAVANTTLDLLVLELVLHRLSVGVLALVLGVLAPVDAGSEDDVLTNGGGIGGRSGAVLCAEAKLGPGFSVSNSGVDRLLVCDISDTSSSLYFLSLVVVSKCNDCFGSILVGNRLGRRQVGGRLFVVVVVGPVVPILMVGSISRKGCHLRLAIFTHLGLGGAVVAMIASIIVYQDFFLKLWP